MKYIITVVLNMFLLSVLYSQNDSLKSKDNSDGWAPGAIIRPNGYIEDGSIKIEDGIYMQNYTTIKNGIGKNFVIYPKKLKGYYFIRNSDTVYYETIKGYTSDLFPNHFWRRIINGKIDVYLYITSFSAGYVMMHEPNFLIKINGNIQQPVITQYNYQKELSLIIRNCADCLNTNSKDPIKNIIDILTTYNKFLLNLKD